MTEPTRQVKYVTRPGVKVVRYAGHDNYDQFYLDGHSRAYGWGVSHAAFDAIFQALEDAEPEKCASCRGTGVTCSCGDGWRAPCQNSHRAIPCPQCRDAAREAGIREVLAVAEDILGERESLILKRAFFPPKQSDAERLREIAKQLDDGCVCKTPRIVADKLREISDRMEASSE